MYYCFLQTFQRAHDAFLISLNQLFMCFHERFRVLEPT